MAVFDRSNTIPDSEIQRENERSKRSLRFLHGAITSEEYLEVLNQEKNDQLNFRQLAADFNEAKRHKKDGKRRKRFAIF